MKNYEIMFILLSNLEQETIKAEIEKAKAIFDLDDSKVKEVKEWGFRELAYEIDHNKRGYYVLFDVEATVEAINEFDRKARFSETIIRHLCIVKGE